MLDALSASIEIGWIIWLDIIPLFPNGSNQLMLKFNDNPPNLMQDLKEQLPTAFRLAKSASKQAYSGGSIDLQLSVIRYYV